MPVVALTEPVAFKKTWMKGNPVEFARTWSISLMQNAYVMIMARPVSPLSTRVHTIPRGRVQDASRISSAVGKFSMKIQ
jgi:hypothetical protein